MTFTQAISSGFRRYFDFRTRSSRSEYWWWTLFSILASVAATVFDEVLFGGTAVLDTLNTIALFIPGLAVAVRRLHDIDRSGWWFLIAFTIIGILLLIYWYVQPGPLELTDSVKTLSVHRPFQIQAQILRGPARYSSPRTKTGSVRTAAPRWNRTLISAALAGRRSSLTCRLAVDVPAKPM